MICRNDILKYMLDSEYCVSRCQFFHASFCPTFCERETSLIMLCISFDMVCFDLY